MLTINVPVISVITVIVTYVTSYKIVCPQQILLNISEDQKIRTSDIETRECSQITFSARESLKSDLGFIKLKSFVDHNSQFHLNISFSNAKWRKSYLKLSAVETENSVCKMYTADVENEKQNEVEFFDTCFNDNKYEFRDYILEYKAEYKSDINYKKIYFKPPHPKYFDNSVQLNERALFAYIDSTNSYELILKIEALPLFYNVSYLKVEVFKQKNSHETLMDVRLIQMDASDEYSFEYITYNTEGYYYFKIAAVNDICLEEDCMKTITPKVYISRKSSPLVIGIVGASFIIPFMLAVFHMWTKRFKNQEEISDSKDKILLVYQPTTDEFNEVIKLLARTIENLACVEVMMDPVILTKTAKQIDSEKWCSDNLLLASHIFYVSGLENYKLDYMTHSYLLEETKKPIPDKDIFILMFPYSTRDIPPFLSNCMIFELMDDFQKLINIFQTNVEYEENTNYIELNKKIKLTQTETESTRIILNVPKIVVTDQSDSDNEPKEEDGLL